MAQIISSINAKLTFLNMVGNRVFWSLHGGYPSSEDLNAPICEASPQFATSLERMDAGLYRFSDDAYRSRGLDPNEARTGFRSVWPAACKPVYFKQPVMEELKAGRITIRFPAMVDADVFARDFVLLARNSIADFNRYRISEERARGMYDIWHRDAGSNQSAQQGKYISYTYPALEYYFDRGVVPGLLLDKYIDWRSIMVTPSEGTYSELQLKVDFSDLFRRIVR